MALKSALERLISEPHLFIFDAAVRLLRLSSPPSQLGNSVRFSAPPSLAQPTAEVLEAHSPQPGKHARLITTLIGLVGPSAEMPRWYTELLALSYRQKSFAITDFFDLLAQPLIDAFASAGSKYRLARSTEQAALLNTEEPIGAGVLALAGFDTPLIEKRLALEPDVFRYYSGFFSSYPRSSSCLASLVSDYLGKPVIIEEFCGSWLTIPSDQQSRLPHEHSHGIFCTLGVDATIGRQVWSQQARFIVRIGPLVRTEFETLLPNNSLLISLVSLIRAYVGLELDFMVNLIIKESEIPPLTLGGQSGGTRLGWTSWLPLPPPTSPSTSKDEAIFTADYIERFLTKAL